jgi:anti-sigma-K factor RskA
MNYERNELIAQLADEYVIGTLRGGARKRFEKMLVSNETARGAVRRAEDQMLGLSLALPLAQPAATTFESIAGRVGLSAGTPTTAAPVRRAPPSSWRMALAAGVAMLALGIAWVVSNRTEPATAVANLATAEGAVLWSLEAYEADARLDIKVTGVVRPEPGRSYELWALPEGGAPVSLGLLPEGGQVSRDLTPTQRDALRLASKVAVSLEPDGGSRTGAPTGPVLYVAEVRANPKPS